MELESLVAALPAITSQRPELDGTGFCLGITSSKQTSGPVVHSHTTNFEGIVSRMLVILKQVCCIPESFLFSSIQTNHNAIIRPHTDKNGGVISMTVSFGDYEGGEFVLGGRWQSSWHQPIYFDGAEEHFVAPFSGDRWSLVLFPHNKIDYVSQNQKDFLRRIGFQLAAPLERPKLQPSQAVDSTASTRTVPQQEPTVPVQDQKMIVMEFSSGLGPLAAAARLSGMGILQYVFESDADCLDVVAKLPGDPQLLGGSCTNFVSLTEQIRTLAQNRKCILSYSPAGDYDMDTIVGISLVFNKLNNEKNMSAAAVMVTEPLSEMQRNEIVGVWASFPFEIRTEDFTPIKKTWWVWISGDISWPKHSASQSGLGDMMRIRPPRFFPTITKGEDCILNGWTWSNKGNNLFEDLKKGEQQNTVARCDTGEERPLLAGEVEALLGLEKDITNNIAKIPGQSLQNRQQRRFSMLHRTPPIRMLAFVLKAIVSSAFDGSWQEDDGLEAYFEKVGGTNEMSVLFLLHVVLGPFRVRK